MIVKPQAFNRRSLLGKTAIFSISFFALAVLFSSCIKNHNDDTASTPVAALMAFNLAPDRDYVGIGLSGNSISNQPIAYGAYTGTYLNIYPGSRDVQAFNFNAGSVIYADTTGDFTADKFYSLFFIGYNNKYRNLLVRDNFDSLSAASGKAYVRYINAIPDSLAVPQVTLTAGANPVATASPVFGTVSDFVAVDPGNLSIAIQSASGIDTSRTITVEAKKAYTILLTGLPGSSAPVEIKYVLNGTLSDNAPTSSFEHVKGIVN